MAEEKMSELEGLAVQAEGLGAADGAADVGAGDAQGQPQAAPLQTNAQLIAGALQLARDTACVLFDLRSPAAVLTDDKCEKLGELWGRVADKRGWDLASRMGDYMEEITALMGTIGIARELAQAVVMEMDAKAKREAERTVEAGSAGPVVADAG